MSTSTSIRVTKCPANIFKDFATLSLDFDTVMNYLFVGGITIQKF